MTRLASTSRPPIDQGAAWALTPAEQDSPPLPGTPRLGLSHARILVEIPPDLNHLKAAHPATATSWRDATRMAFQHYLARGYAATDAARIPDARGDRVAYLLELVGPDAEGVPAGEAFAKGDTP